MGRKTVNKGFYVDVENVESEIRKIGLYEIEKKESIRRIVRSTAKKTVKSAKRRVTFKKTGNTRKSIKAKYYNYGLLAIVKPRLPKGWKAHFFELGTKQRKTKSGKNTGKIKARPFMGPAEDEVRPGYLADLKKEVMK